MTKDNDEIDIRPYILLIKKKWWVITLFAAVPAVIVLIITLMLPRKYVTTAMILLNRSRPMLALAEQFPTLNEPVDTRSRMDALLLIAQSDEIALSTYQEIVDKIPPELRNLQEFRKQVQIKDKGDTIQVSVGNEDASLATEIANTWAAKAVSAINLAYNGQQLPTELNSELKAAQDEYESAQKEYEDYISGSKINYLENKVTESTTLLNLISQQRAERISYLTARIQAMEQLALQTEALKEQIDHGSTSKAAGIGDALSVLRSRASSFGLEINPATDQTGNANPGSEYTIQLTNPEDLIDNQELYVRELDAIIKQAETEKNKSLEDIQALANETIEGSDEQLSLDIAGNINLLKTELEQERRREMDIVFARDLAWQTYQALTKKKIEINTSAETNNLVSLASRAIPPERPAPRGMISNVLLAGIAGGILGVFFVVLQYWWTSTSSDQSEKVVSSESEGSKI